MKFTQPAFVRVQNPAERKELIEWLWSIGYEVRGATNGHQVTTVLDTGIAFVGRWPTGGKHDCGTNVALFKALAAMNDSNDREQWFTDGKEWILCDREDWMGMYRVLCAGYRVDARVRSIELDQHHKATAEEIIERFKNQRP